jgi:tRNA pseudouridine65 synthase
MADPTPLLPLVWADDHLAVFNKPSGLLVHRGWAQDEIVALELARRALGRFVYPLHRLDRGASGALLFALDRETARALSAHFEAGTIAKRYLALVRGITPEEGVIDYPIPRQLGAERVPALTRFRRLGTFERFSLVEARPETGRLHQIRRHFKHLSHPLVGDVDYGKGDINRLFRTRFGLHRLALHAASLAFPHPQTGERLTIEAPLPPDLAGPLVAMGLVEEG